MCFCCSANAVSLTCYYLHFKSCCICKKPEQLCISSAKCLSVVISTFGSAVPCRRYSVIIMFHVILYIIYYPVMYRYDLFKVVHAVIKYAWKDCICDFFGLRLLYSKIYYFGNKCSKFVFGKYAYLIRAEFCGSE